MTSPISTLMPTNVSPNRLSEVRWLQDYIDSGQLYGDPIFLSLGESWEDTPPDLLKHLATSPSHAHGYQISNYGYPPLQCQLREFVTAEYSLSPRESQRSDWECAVSANGTRAKMADYARLLRDEYAAKRQPVLISLAPSWDYHGVFEAEGYKTHFINLSPLDSFSPNVEEILAGIDLITKDASLAPMFALNPQQNPTGVNWTQDTVDRILEELVQRDIPLLLDDAHFSTLNISEEPTKALRTVLKLAEGTSYRWLHVRSLGKQFGCNGWGIGVVCGPTKLLESLLSEYSSERHYNINGLAQYAFSRFLLTEDASDYTLRRRKLISQTRQQFCDLLESELGFPSFFRASCTNFQLFPVPQRYQVPEGVLEFVKRSVLEAGVLFTSAWPLPYDSSNLARYDFARVYLTPTENAMIDAVDRLKKIGMYYDA